MNNSKTIEGGHNIIIWSHSLFPSKNKHLLYYIELDHRYLLNLDCKHSSSKRPRKYIRLAFQQYTE